MSPRIYSFLLSIVLLIVFRVMLFVGKQRGRPLLDESVADPASWNLTRLLLASFLTLFAELALIRWIAVEVRVFAYVKNLTLLLCFVGFGLGCALARSSIRWPVAVKAFIGLLVVIRIPYGNGMLLEGLSQSLGAAGDVAIWSAGSAWTWTRFLGGAAVAAILFLLMVWIFVPLGQIVSRQMDRAPSPLSAYSWNLFGSLAGILAFLGVSRMMMPPWFWLGIVLIGFAFLQRSRRDRYFVTALVLPLFLLLYEPSNPDHRYMWTPYQQIQYERRYMSDGDLKRGVVWVNHTGYQWIVNLSPDFLERNPNLVQEPIDENPYNLAFRFATPNPSVMIVGSGTGNDVAAALRNGAKSVDAVEIDPAILQLGKEEHPERPYDSPKVTVHLNDARAFLKRTRQQYDLVLFGLLDSHTQLSDYANMRIDNFVYTEESFLEARRHLTPNGILFVKFQVDYPWITRRLAEMLTQTFGQQPLIFRAESSYSTGATCFAVSQSDQVEKALAMDPRLAAFASQHAVRLQGKPVPITTDDWPYLYQEGRWIPRTYYSLAVLVILVALGLYSRIPDARRQAPSLFFFSMGAGFLLLETQVISRLALFFGTTWQVNGVVISALLVALLLANFVVDRTKRTIPRFGILLALLVALALAYLLPINRLPGSPATAGALATAVFAIPVFFAGILFALEFRVVDSPSAALGANILGAVAGGLLENLSLIIGMRAQLLIAIGLYCLAGVGLWRRRRAVVNP